MRPFQIAALVCAFSPGLLRAEEPPLTLDGLLAQVLQRSPELRGRAAEVRAARERPAQARAFEDPMIMVELWQAPVDLRHVPLMLTVRQPIPWPGKLRARALALEPEVDRVQAGYRSQERSLLLQAARAYYDYRLAIRSIDVQNENRKLLGTIQQVVEVRYQVGKAELAEVLRAREAVASLENVLLDLLRQRDISQGTINMLLDLPPDSALGRPESAPAFAFVPELGELQELIKQALAQRPELAMARASVAQTEGKVRAAQVERAPDLAVWAGFMAMLRGGADHTFTVGLASSIPSFSIQKTRAMAREALAEGDARKAELAQLQARIRGEVREALLRLETAMRHIALHRDSLIPLSEQAVKAAQASYQSGRGDLLLLLDAVRSLVEHRLEHERFLAEYGQRQAELLAAVGASLLDKEVLR